MLLSLMRKHAKSWLIKTLIAIIALVFVFYFGYSFTADERLKMAYVNGELITAVEYDKTYREMLETLQNRYRGMWNEDMARMFRVREQALEQLINQRLISQAARRLGLDVTEQEIQQAIMSYPAFQVDGYFDLRRYHSLLYHNRMEPADFESSMAQDLLSRKLQQFLYAFLNVSKEEALESYTYENEQVNVAFVRFIPGAFRDQIEPDEAGLAQFYEERKEQYRVPEKIQVTYIEIDPKTFEEKVVISEIEVEDFYEVNLAQYALPKRVKARHILFKLPEGASEEEVEAVRVKAEQILGSARAEGADFAQLATEHSEDVTAAAGGDLGYFEPGQMDPAFESAAFALEPGQMSELVRSRFGYHIILVEEIQEAGTKSLPDVQEEIERALKHRLATEMAHEKGLSLLDQMPYDTDLALYASQHDLETRQSSFFGQNQPIPEFPQSPNLGSTLFGLRELETSDLTESGGKYYIFQLAETRPSVIPPLEEVVTQVEADYASYRADQEANAAASAYLKRLQEGASWEEMAEEKGMNAEETGFFKRHGMIPKIGRAPDLQEAAFGLHAEAPYPQRVFQTQEGILVVRWLAFQGIDPEEFEKAKEEYRITLMEQQHQRIFESWLKSLRDKAKIKILQPVVQS